MSEKAKETIKNVNATMALEGMPLTEREKELLGKFVDGELTGDEVRRIMIEELFNE